jgi:hypothetical protein
LQQADEDGHGFRPVPHGLQAPAAHAVENRSGKKQV